MAYKYTVESIELSLKSISQSFGTCARELEKMEDHITKAAGAHDISDEERASMRGMLHDVMEKVVSWSGGTDTADIFDMDGEFPTGYPEPRLCVLCKKVKTSRHVDIGPVGSGPEGPITSEPVCTDCLAPCEELGDDHCSPAPCVCQMRDSR